MQVNVPVPPDVTLLFRTCSIGIRRSADNEQVYLLKRQTPQVDIDYSGPQFNFVSIIHWFLLEIPNSH